MQYSRQILDYYLHLVNAEDVFSLSFPQRKNILLLSLHDFFTNKIELVDVCNLATFLEFTPDQNNAHHTELDDVIWACSECIQTEESSALEVTNVNREQLLQIIKKYYQKYQSSIDVIVTTRVNRVLIA